MHTVWRNSLWAWLRHAILLSQVGICPVKEDAGDTQSEHASGKAQIRQAEVGVTIIVLLLEDVGEGGKKEVGKTVSGWCSWYHLSVEIAEKRVKPYATFKVLLDRRMQQKYREIDL